MESLTTGPTPGQRYNMDELGRRVATLRRIEVLTQQELANRAQVGLKTVLNIEKGHPGVACGLVFKVLDALGLSQELTEALSGLGKHRETTALLATRLPRRVRHSKAARAE